MAGVPGFEQVPRFRELIDRLIAEDAEFVPQGFVLQNDRPEWAYLARERLWMSDLFIAAVAATREGVGISNRPQSGTIVVITHMLNVGTGFVQVSQPASPAVPPNYVTTGFCQVRDSRLTNMTAQTLARNTVAGQGRAPRWLLPPGATPLLLPLPIVLGPDSSVTFEATADNVTVEVSLAGYEHAVRAEELAP